MKAPSTMTIARRAVATVSSMLRFSLIPIVLLSGCENTEQSQPQSQTAAQEKARPSYPVIGGQARSGQSGQSGQSGYPAADSADQSFFGRIEAGDVAGVQAALEAGADPNAKNAQGLSALQLATIKGHSAIVEVLLEKQPVLGVGETQPGSPEFESLQCAATQGDIGTTQALIDRGVDINVQEPHTQQTSLFLAAQRGQVETVKMLLENGANPNIKGPRGYPPLVEVATKGQFEIAELLLQYRANPNATEDINQWTALMMAAARADAQLVELLVNYGADITITDRKGKTAVDIAYQRNDAETIAAIQAKPQPPSGFAVAKKEATGLILIPAPSKAAQETQQPEPTEPSATAADAQKSKQITQLLARAQKQFQQKNLTSPKGDNALDTCLEIFELTPGHADTAELVRKMEQQYRDWAATTKSAARRKTYTEKAQELAALTQ